MTIQELKKLRETEHKVEFKEAKEVSMKDFVDAFNNQLTREQVKTLIYKLENERLIEKSGGGRSIKYTLNRIIHLESSIFEQFTTKLSQ